jgi:ATP-dependent 26S proteasome regulatory subunit
MTTAEALDDLRSRILSHYTLLFLETFEEERWRTEISNLAEELQRELVTWSVTEGPQPPSEPARPPSVDPLEFLEQVAAYPRGRLFLLKDFHPYLENPLIIRKLRDLVPLLAAEDKSLLFLGPVGTIPVELQKDAIGLELPLPGLEELRIELTAVLNDRTAASGNKLPISAAEEERLLKAVLGLTAREARKALARALWNRDALDDDVYAALVSEKKNMVSGSDLLEFYELDDGVGDIGGLEGLKDWIAQRAEAFSTRAQEQGIPTPKGVLLLGVQGCGKSLTARATARLLSFPLVRLDAANLLSSDRGVSEKNMRNVLSLMETIAPAVLWLDEIEKGFAGSDGGAGGDAAMSRIMGRFLTWMEEKKAPVFVIATANSISSLPPEMLRRGRFDELFFVDLPNYEERKEVFRIHLSKRGWKPEKYDLDHLADLTEGYSGAEIEQIVIAAMLETFSQGRILGQQDLKRASEDTVPLSVTMEEKIFELREWARTRCRPATPDSRVMQMIDEERRQVEIDLDVDGESPQTHEWAELAEHGQLSAAIVEYVRLRDRVTFPQLQDAFVEYIETVGDQGLALRSDPNVVLWLTLSGELAGAISKLVAAKKLYVHPVAVDVYKSSGHSLRLPLLEELNDQRVPRPMWLPVCLRDLPSDDESGRFVRLARMKLSK